jgi:hypothetical protein
MPKAPIDLNNFLMAGQYDIRPSWQTFLVKSKPVSHSPDNPTNLYFRICVARSDGRHVSASRRPVMDIHWQKSPLLG